MSKLLTYPIDKTMTSIREIYWKSHDRLQYFLRLNSYRLNNIFSTRSIIATTASPVVSLTSYGGRVDSVYLTIESIATGSLLPNRIILWIDDKKIFMNLPSHLKRLKKRGLEIKLSENFGPHTKYYPYIEEESAFSIPLVTADDDVIYPTNWLEGLWEGWINHPENINCHGARFIEINGGKFLPYISWKHCVENNESYRNFALGVFGVIYPPRFQEELKIAGRAFMNICPKQDDIWLHLTAVRTGWKIRQLSENILRGLRDIPGTQDQALFHDNQFGSGNDIVIMHTYKNEEIKKIEGTTEVAP